MLDIMVLYIYVYIYIYHCTFLCHLKDSPNKYFVKFYDLKRKYSCIIKKDEQAEIHEVGIGQGCPLKRRPTRDSNVLTHVMQKKV